MLQQKRFLFNPFAENTYVIYTLSADPTSGEVKGIAVIIDPGCHNTKERAELKGFISKHALKPVLLLNTHAHLDHVLGNDFVFNEYGLKPLIHKDELKLLQALSYTASIYGVEATPSPEPERFIEENEIIKWGDVGTIHESSLKVIYAPGHSPGGVCFYAEKEKMLWAGDVLFRDSIGRTDLPGGDYDTLVNNIRTKLFTLPDDVEVFSGHGEPTTIGYEKKHNPFVGEHV